MSSSFLKVFSIRFFLSCLGLNDEGPCDGVGLSIKNDLVFFFFGLYS